VDVLTSKIEWGERLHVSTQKMDLTQYHIAYDLKFEEVSKTVKKAISDYNNRIGRAAGFGVVLGMDGDLPLHKIDSINDMMGQMLWSSGFLSKIHVSKENHVLKEKKHDYIVKVFMKKMTDEEKKHALAHPDDTEQSDPVAEPMD